MRATKGAQTLKAYYIGFEMMKNLVKSLERIPAAGYEFVCRKRESDARVVLRQRTDTILIVYEYIYARKRTQTHNVPG